MDICVLLLMLLRLASSLNKRKGEVHKVNAMIVRMLENRISELHILTPVQTVPCVS